MWFMHNNCLIKLFPLLLNSYSCLCVCVFVWGCVLSSLIFCILNLLSHTCHPQTLVNIYFDCLMCLYMYWIFLWKILTAHNILTTEAVFFLLSLNKKHHRIENENIERKCKSTKPKQKRINLTRGNKSVQTFQQWRQGKKNDATWYQI